MIAGASCAHATSSDASSAADDWRPAFLRMLPAIQTHARITFRDLNATEREAVQEVIANALIAFVRLWEQGRAGRQLEHAGRLRRAALPVRPADWHAAQCA